MQVNEQNRPNVYGSTENSRLEIKGTSSKRKTLEKMLVKDYDYNDPYMINRIIIGKFHEEKITDVHQINSVCECFANSIDNLINAISDDDIIIDDYVKDTFELEESVTTQTPTFC